MGTTSLRATVRELSGLGTKGSGEIMDAKQEIQEIVYQIVEGTVDPETGWSNMRSLKDTYYKQYNSQS